MTAPWPPLFLITLVGLLELVAGVLLLLGKHPPEGRGHVPPTNRETMRGLRHKGQTFVFAGIWPLVAGFVLFAFAGTVPMGTALTLATSSVLLPWIAIVIKGLLHS